MLGTVSAFASPMWLAYVRSFFFLARNQCQCRHVAAWPPLSVRFQYCSFTGEAAVHMAEAALIGRAGLVPSKSARKLFSAWLHWRLDAWTREILVGTFQVFQVMNRGGCVDKKKGKICCSWLSGFPDYTRFRISCKKSNLAKRVS